MGKTKRGKGTKLMAVADRSGFPLAVYAASAARHEVTLVTETLAEVLTAEGSERLIGDKAYDSDPLDAELREQGIIAMRFDFHDENYPGFVHPGCIRILLRCCL